MSKNTLLSLSLTSLLTILLLTIYVSTGITELSDPLDAAPASTGLLVLAAAHDMDQSGIAGQEITFDPDDFARALNLSTVPAITVTALPPVTDGELLVGSARVHAGQTVSRGVLDMLTFVPASPYITDSSFTFRIGNSGYDIRCEVHFLDHLNRAPSITAAEPTLTEITDTAHLGQLILTDPENDSTRLLPVTYPAKGSLLVPDPARAVFRYTPAPDAKGTDTFAFVAVDEWGNMSAQIVVTVELRGGRVVSISP